MKWNYISTVILIAMMIFSIEKSHANGVLVFDPTTLKQTLDQSLKRAKEAAGQLKQLRQEYEQQVKYAEEQKKRLEGFTDFSRGLDTAKSYMKESLDDIVSDSKDLIEDERNKYNLKSDDKVTQDKFDAIINRITFYEKFNESINHDAERIMSLQKLLSTADTPQKKDDFKNQLSIEQMMLDMKIKQYDLAGLQMQSVENAQREHDRNAFMKQLAN